jgi:hypothetical protein
MLFVIFLVVIIEDYNGRGGEMFMRSEGNVGK